MDDVHVLTFIDYNVPRARGKESCAELVKTAASLNALNKARNACLVIFPDLAKDSCARGLFDEEEQIQKEFWSQKQFLDIRWIHTFDVEDRSAGMSQLRRWTSGRIAVHAEAKDSDWTQASELAVVGRPLGLHGQNIMPKSSALILPENLDADADLRVSERLRPAKETLMAQKGMGNLTTILMAALKGVPFDGRPCLVVNLTGYIKDMALMVATLFVF